MYESFSAAYINIYFAAYTFLLLLDGFICMAAHFDLKNDKHFYDQVTIVIEFVNIKRVMLMVFTSSSLLIM